MLAVSASICCVKDFFEQHCQSVFSAFARESEELPQWIYRSSRMCFVSQPPTLCEQSMLLPPLTWFVLSHCSAFSYLIWTAENAILGDSSLKHSIQVCLPEPPPCATALALFLSWLQDIKCFMCAHCGQSFRLFATAHFDHHCIALANSAAPRDCFFGFDYRAL